MYKFFKTIKVEHDRPIEGTITGDVPSWIDGSLYRNGPGIFEIGEDKYKHYFDPLAMLQRFHILDKKVYYQCRYLRSDTYKTNMEAGRIMFGGFGTAGVPDPSKNIFQRIMAVFEISKKNDNCLVSFFPLKDELYAATESHLTHRVDPETLESIEKVNLTEHVAVHFATAHPHWDADGTIHNIGHNFKGRPKICIFKVPPKIEKDSSFPKGEVVSAIESEYKTCINYFHSFGMTENYYVYVEQPLLINFLKLMKNKVEGKDTNSAIIFYEDIKARFRIIDKRTRETVNPDIRYEADPFAVYHHINAYEDSGHIVLDICSWKNKELYDWFYLKNLTKEDSESEFRKFGDVEPHRYVLPLDVASDTPKGTNLVTLKDTVATAVRKEDGNVHCTREVLAETGFEFPQINYALYNGKKYKYTYGVGFHSTGPQFNTVCKLDLEKKTFTEWAEDNCFPSEPVFVGSPDGKDEDDGVVLSAVNCTEFESGKRAFLLILDAKTMKEIARADFNVPRFPKDFHGMFRPSTV